MSELEVVTTLDESQAKQLYELFTREWWTLNRSYEDVQHILKHSLCIALVEKNSRKVVGFSRVVTDRLVFGMILDVIIDPSYRGNRHGKRLLHEILNHPDLALVQRLELKCLPEMMPFYEKCGFSPFNQNLCTMTFNPKTVVSGATSAQSFEP